MKNNKLGYILLSLAISLLLLWILGSTIRVEELVLTIRNIHLPFLFVFFLLSLSNSSLRALRYKWLLHPAPISFGNVFLVTMIRNLFVDLLPARVGSLSYIYILNKRLNFSFETAASSFVVAFVFDFLTLSPFLVLAVFAAGSGITDISITAMLLVAFVFFILILLFFLKLQAIGRILLQWVKAFFRVTRLEKRRWAHLVENKWNQTLDELDHIKTRGIYWPIFGLSLGIRLMKYGALYFLLAALLRSHGFWLKNISFWKTILGITGAEMTSVLPIKGIGGFGTWESAWALTFKLLGFDPKLAVLSGISVHLITNLFEYILGFIAILILVVPLMLNKRKEKDHENVP